MKKIIYIVIGLIFANCKGSEINHQKIKNTEFSKSTYKMDTIYKQKFNDLLLSFVRNNYNSKVEWKTILKNKSGKELILHNDIFEKDSAWTYKESISESPIDLYNISGSLLDGKNLYVIYNRFGRVSVVKFSFTENENFTKDEKVILNTKFSGGSGKMSNQADFRKINTDLYFSLYYGQSYTGTKVSLYKFNSDSFQKIKQIQWGEKIKRIKTISISDFGRKWYKNEEKILNSFNKLSLQDKEKEVPPSKEDVLKFNLLKNHVDKTFSYQDMDLDQETYREKESILNNLGLENYQLFINSEKKIEEFKIKRAEEYINDVLLKFKISKNVSKVKLLDYIYESEKEKIIFFFYKDSLETKIIRYNNYNSEWLIGDCKEEEIKQP
jgi:hypothetical protein